MLARDPKRELLAADFSGAMLEVAAKVRDPAVVSRFHLLQCSAFDITLPDNSVDCIFSIRLMHQIGKSANRIAMLREFHRVSRDTVIVAVNVGTPVESEFRQAGFKILNYQEFLPGSRRWCVYVLRKRG